VPINVGGAILNDRIFKKRDAKTQVTIKDGYTIALGGLTAETEDNDSSKIPFLGDLPLLGQLFRSDVSNEASTNLIIFLTAKTLNPDGSTYADMIDPRQLEVMQLTPAQIPGYEVPADELELIHSIEAKREQEISEEYKNTLDRATDQVMIESKFIEVSNGDLSDIGVDWAYLNENAGDLLGGSGAGSGNPGFNASELPEAADGAGVGIGSGIVEGGLNAFSSGLANVAAGGASGGLVAVFSSSQFAATLTAIQTENRSKLVSNPTIVVMNNQQAVFQVGEDYPIREFSVNDQTGQLETGELEYRFVGIELDVTPSVNAAGMITLDVNPVVSALGGLVTTGAGVGGLTELEDRIFKKREAKTQVTIKDGYTIALGGLTAETEDNDSSKIPFLGDLPFLGQLFRSDVSNEASTNLIIFLTAKTLNPDGSTYADVIDPRQLEVMQLTPAQIPGYEVPADELELIHSIEAKREQEISEEYKTKINAAIDGPKASKARWFK